MRAMAAVMGLGLMELFAGCRGDNQPLRLDAGPDTPAGPDGPASTCEIDQFLLAGAANTCQSCREPCGPGSYEVTACSREHDRVCSTCQAIDSCIGVTCTAAGDSRCVSCPPGRYSTGTTCAACTPCGPGQNEATACTTEHNRSCTECTPIPDCAAHTCATDSDQVCTACASGHYLDGNECPTCTAACGPGTFEGAACSSTHDRACVGCLAISHCTAQTCTTAADTVCSACAAGYFLKGNACVPCTGTCGTGAYESVACGTAHDRVCSACASVSDCVATTCTGAGDAVCTECAAGHFWNGVTCATCATCAGGQKESASCTTEHDRACTSCPVIPNCTAETCAATADPVCSACANGSYLSHNACVPCSATCAAGTFASVSCASDHDRVCTGCTTIDNCANASCASASDQLCGTCSAGHHLDGNACVACTAACSPGSYESVPCASGQDRRCLTCTPIEHCASDTCTTAGDGVCLSCDAGFFLMGNACVACAGACGAGSRESAACTSEHDRTCTACTALASCSAATCTTATDQLCTTCQAGYHWDGHACASCRSCLPGQNESAACTTEHDRACTGCTVIPSCAEETCTTTSDQVCLTCATGLYLNGNACLDCAGACGDGTYESASCTGTHDRACTPCRGIDHCAALTCVAGTDQVCGACAAGYHLVDNACVACSDGCGAGTHEVVACTTAHDRSCAACTVIDHCTASTCASGTDQVCQACQAGDHLLGNACVPCTSACEPGTFESTACATESDRSCSACTPIVGCTAETCTTAGDQVCGACEVGSFLAGNACLPCTGACGAGSYESTACSTAHDRVCSPCAAIASCTATTCTTAGNQVCLACDAGRFWNGAACAACASCSSGQQESTACTTEHDRACTSCAAITNCTAETCTNGADQVCTACATGFSLNGNACVACRGTCEAGTFESAACTTAHDRACQACTAIGDCTAVTCTSASDQLCSSCASGHHVVDNACLPCTGSCAAGTFEDTSCTTAHDRSCPACTTITHCAGLTCASGVDQVCGACDVGFHLTGNACVACAAACDAGTFEDVSCTTAHDRSCVGCSAIGHCAVDTCSGPSDQLCSACDAGYFLSHNTCLLNNNTPVGAADLLSPAFKNACVRVIAGSALTANDNRGAPDESGQTLTITSVADPVGGTVVLNGGNVEFTPALDYLGPAGFSYIALDDGMSNGSADFKSTQATAVSFDVVVSSLIASDDQVTLLQNSAATAIPVLDNDDDLTGTATIASTTTPAHGLVTVASDRLSLAYTPQAGYCNTQPGAAVETFSYTLSPGGSAGIVSVTVTCGPASPLCGNGICGTGEAADSCPADCLPKNFDGLGVADAGGAYPPKANGDVGPTHYVQAINGAIAMFRKTDAVRVATTTFNAFMSQGHFGNLCDTNNVGDPIILYDSFEDRWLIADVAYATDSSKNILTATGAFECIAASKTGDPVAGGWNFYSINTAGGLGDSPKLGIWPDGLYMSVNMVGYPAARTFLNPRVYAFNKAQMYAGTQTIQSISFDAPPAADFGLLPSNARLQTGTPPPGTPNYFVSTWQFYDGISIYKFHVDWNRLTTSTFSGSTFSLASNFAPSAAVANAPALGGNALEVVEWRAMMQNQYSNFGGTESLWTTHTVRRGDTTGFAAPRWYQANVTGGTVAATLPQAATWDPDSANVMYRFLPSLAVDRMGDLALGYTTSSSTTKPAIKYAGRLMADPINTFSKTEQVLIQGGGTQTGSCGGVSCTRWGDYSAMSLDRDGCTFWFTSEYYPVDGVSYSSRIGSFSFPQCVRVGDGGALSGVVRNSVSNAAIGGATVALGSRTTTANAAGAYAFLDLPAGTYPALTASAAGFVSSTVPSVAVSDGLTSTQGLTLAPVAAASPCSTDTSQADFQTGGHFGVDLLASPGNVILKNVSVEGTDLISSPASLSTSNNLSATVWTGQTFRAGVTGTLTRISVGLGLASGTSGRITVEIRNLSGANPGTTVLASTTTIGPVNNVGTATLYTTTFATPAAVVSGTSYAVVLRTSVGNTVYGVRGSTAGGSTLANGQVFTTTNSGTTWTGVAADLYFTTYVTPSVSYQSGNFVSGAKDLNPPAGFVPTWSTLAWTASGSGSVLLQAAASNGVDGPFSFVGPDGTASTFFSSGASLSQFNGFRYLRYKALLSTTDQTQTPALNDVTVCSALTARPLVCVP